MSIYRNLKWVLAINMTSEFVPNHGAQDGFPSLERLGHLLPRVKYAASNNQPSQHNAVLHDNSDESCHPCKL